VRGPRLDNLLASPLVDTARTCSRSAFPREVDVPILVVSVETPESELATALMSTAAGERASLVPSIGFRTRSPVPGARTPARRAPLSASMLERRIAHAPHVAIALRKRVGAGKDFSERISVGRATNNDIVLRHEGVSKFHAWFVCDEEQSYYAADAGSRNGTMLNGARLDDAPVRIVAGDLLAFGGVEALVCSAEVFWDTIAGRL
jgi:hypothetical protein